jgi:hypothetical protein
MEKSTLAIRLESDLVQVLDDQAKTAGLTRSAHLASIIESHLRANGSGRGASPSDDLRSRHDQTLQALRALSAETSTLTQIVVLKEREASADFTELSKQIDQLRADIATQFGVGAGAACDTRPVFRLTEILRNRLFGCIRSRYTSHSSCSERANS